jgi:hypothetical protein
MDWICTKVVVVTIAEEVAPKWECSEGLALLGG